MSRGVGGGVGVYFDWCIKTQRMVAYYVSLDLDFSGRRVRSKVLLGSVGGLSFATGS